MKELEVLLTGLAFPVVLIDLGRQSAVGLKDLGLVSLHAPDARILVLDPEAGRSWPALARELGATHVFSGFVPPPVVAELTRPMGHGRAERASNSPAGPGQPSPTRRPTPGAGSRTTWASREHDRQASRLDPLAPTGPAGRPPDRTTLTDIRELSIGSSAP